MLAKVEIGLVFVAPNCWWKKRKVLVENDDFPILFFSGMGKFIIGDGNRTVDGNRAVLLNSFIYKPLPFIHISNQGSFATIIKMWFFFWRIRGKILSSLHSNIPSIYPIFIHFFTNFFILIKIIFLFPKN